MIQKILPAFGAKSTALEVIEGHRLDGINAIVTGAYSGIGIETARALAMAGASVTLAVRDIAKGRIAASELKEHTGNENVQAAALDLSDLSSVRSFALAYRAAYDKLGVLINNAGIMACPLTYTKDGFESQFATNHLGHFLLSVLLIHALQKGAPSRVVSLSSIGHRRSDVHLDDINYKVRTYDKWEAYGQSKTANVQFAVALTEHYKDCGVIANAVMPGGIFTELQKHIPLEERRELGWLSENNEVNKNFKTPEQGAATSIWAAVAPELNGVGGHYLEDCQIAKPWSAELPFNGFCPYALDPEKSAQLWQISESMVGKA